MVRKVGIFLGNVVKSDVGIYVEGRRTGVRSRWIDGEPEEADINKFAHGL